jgi:F-type H+-transporting ATPase subunit c
MDPIAAKYIGAGIACIGMGGAGAGVGIFGFAVTEALGIFSLLIALLLLFAL